MTLAIGDSRNEIGIAPPCRVYSLVGKTDYTDCHTNNNITIVKTLKSKIIKCSKSF